MILSQRAGELCHLSRRELHDTFMIGRPVDLAAITDYCYRGVSLGLPTLLERLSWKKFAKTFARTDEGLVRGHNLRIEQDGLDKPWTLSLRNGKPRPFGPYQVTRVPGTVHVEIDYGLGSHGLSPLRLLRDPLRRLDDASDLLLGVSLIDVGFAKRLATPSYFLLERDQPL